MISKKERSVHLDTLSEVDIADYLQHLGPLFGGVYANDELHKPDPKKIYVLNLQNSHEPGSHWTVLHNRSYYDSYGVVPTEAISKFVKQHNTENYQGLNKESCGYFCMYVADNLAKGLPPYNGMVPGKIAHNENVLKAYFY